MTQDEIIALAREAGFYGLPVDTRLERFAALVLEKAAQLLESGVLGHGECAAAIRGLKP